MFFQEFFQSSTRTAGGIVYKGNILVAADFPTANSVQVGDMYQILAYVTDDDPTRTNTNQSFVPGNEIYWNGANWSDFGSINLDSFFANDPIQYDNVTGVFSFSYTSRFTLTGGALDLVTPEFSLAGENYLSYNPTNGVLTANQIDLASTNVTGILPNTNTTASSSNTSSAIVSRDSSGNFSASGITANTLNVTNNSSALSGTNKALNFSSALSDGNYINLGGAGRNIGVNNLNSHFLSSGLDWDSTANNYVYSNNLTAAGLIELNFAGIFFKYAPAGTAGASVTPSLGLLIEPSGLVTIPGNLTVTGSITGTLSGNASTATALQNARTIGAVSFDGTANIVPQTIQTIDDSADTSCFLLFANASGSQTSGQQPKTNSGLTYNAVTNTLSATTFSGSFSGTVTNATNVNISDNSASATRYFVWSPSFGSPQSLSISSTKFYWNPAASSILLDGTTTATFNVRATDSSGSTSATINISRGLLTNSSALFTLQTAGTDVWSCGMTTGSSLFSVYDNVNSLLQLSIAQGNGGSVTIHKTTAATTLGTGALVCLGGSSFAGSIWASGALNITSTTASSSTTTGSGIFAGGVGIAGKVNIGGNLDVVSNINISSYTSGSTTGFLNFGTNTLGASYITIGNLGRTIGVEAGNGDLFIARNITYDGTYKYLNTGGSSQIVLTTTGGNLKYAASGTAGTNATLSTALSWDLSGIINIPATTSSSSNSTGALTIGGGIGAGGNIYGGGVLNVASTITGVTSLTINNGPGNSSSATNAAILALNSNVSATAGNIYGAYIQKSGTDLFYWGINKNTVTGSVPANALYISSFSSSGSISIGRGNGAGLMSTSDLFIDSSGRIITGNNPTFSSPSIFNIYENTANTSTAGLTIQNAGAGDAVTHFIASNTWSIGNDNTDDYFKISNSGDLSTNNYFSIDTTGKTIVSTFYAGGTAVFASDITSISGYPCSFLRAWVSFNGTANSNQAATYSRSGTTVTVTLNNHGYLVNHVINCTVTTGTLASGTYTITAVTTNTFTFTSGVSGATSGSLTLNRNTIYNQNNIHSISDLGTGTHYINFLTTLPDVNYAPVFGYQTTGSILLTIDGASTGPDVRTTSGFQVNSKGTGGTNTDLINICVGIIR